MTSLDTELFNEFKRLDKLLKESRGTEHGVTDYIDEMKEIPLYESDSIPDWDQDLDLLWCCRHLRNQLAHDTVSEDYPLCDPEDVELLKSFYARVLQGDDPLARLRKYRIQVRESRPRSAAASPPLPPRHSQDRQERQERQERQSPPLQPWPPSYNRIEKPSTPANADNNGCFSCLICVLCFSTALCAVPFVAALILMLTR